MPEVEVKKEEKPDQVVEMLKGMQAQNQQLTAALASLKTELQTTRQQVAAVTAPKPKAPEPKKIRETFLVDQDEALDELKKQTKDETKQELRAEFQRETRMANVITGLRTEWPELEDDNSPMTVATLKNFNQLPKEEQTPSSMELAAIRASQGLNLKPKSQRDEDIEPDFVVGKSGGSQKQERRRGKEGLTENGLDQRTETFATLLGRDPKNIKQYADRATWGKYRGKGEK